MAEPGSISVGTRRTFASTGKTKEWNGSMWVEVSDPAENRAGLPVPADDLPDTPQPDSREQVEASPYPVVGIHEPGPAFGSTASSIGPNADVRGNPMMDPNRSAAVDAAISALRGHPVTGPMAAFGDGMGDSMIGAAYGPMQLVSRAAGRDIQAPPMSADLFAPQEGAVNRFANAAGHGAGMVISMGAGGLSGASGMAAYGLMQPGDVGDRVRGGAFMGALGVGAKVVPPLVASGLGRVSPRAAEAFTGAMTNPIKRPLVDTAAFYPVELASGKGPVDALVDAAGMAAGVSAAHPISAPAGERLSRTPAEREMAGIPDGVPRIGSESVKWGRRRGADSKQQEIDDLLAEFRAESAAREGEIAATRETRQVAAQQAAERAAAAERLRLDEVEQKKKRDEAKTEEIMRQRKIDAESRRQANAQKERESGPGSDYYLGTGVPQEGYNAAARVAGRVLERGRQRRAERARVWSEIGEGATADNPYSRTATAHNEFTRNPDATTLDLVNSLKRIPRTITNAKDIKVPAESEVGRERASYARDMALQRIARDLGKDVVDEIVDVSRRSQEFEESGRSRWGARGDDVIPHKTKGVDTKDRTRAYQEIAGGKQDSPLVEALLRGDHAADMAGMKMADAEAASIDAIFDRNNISRYGRQPEIAARLLEKFDTHTDPAKFLSDPEVRALLQETPSPRDMVGAVREARDYYDYLWHIQDANSRSINGRPMPRLEGAYVNRTARRGGLLNPMLRLKSERAREVERVTGETSRSDRVNSGNRMRRSGEDPEMVIVGDTTLPREWNLYTLMNEASTTAIRNIIGDARMHENLLIAKTFELMGETQRAESIRKITNQAYNSENHGIGAALDKWARPEVRALLATNKRLFDLSKYSANPNFSLARQWTSLLPQAAKNPVAATLAMSDWSDPGAVGAIMKLYAARAKSAGGASIRRQADGSLIGGGGNRGFRADSARMSAERAGEVLLGGVSDGMEMFTVVHSGLIARRVGMSRGYTGRRLSNFISDEIGKTQSFYDKVNKAGILNSRIFQGSVPAQSFGVELVNQMRESAGLTGAYQNSGGTARRVYNTGATLGAVIAGNAITSMLRGYGQDDRGIKTVVDKVVEPFPGSGIVFGTGPGNGNILTASQINDFYKAIEYADRGKYDEAFRMIARNWIPAGTFAGDVVTGRFAEQFTGRNGGDSGGRENYTPITSNPVAPAPIPRPVRVNRPAPIRQPARRR